MQQISMEEAYSGILDLDQGGPEVYETPDTPSEGKEEPQQNNWDLDLEPGSDNIDVSTLTNDAKDKFEDSRLDTSHADFSDRVGKIDYQRRRIDGLGRDFGFLNYRTKDHTSLPPDEEDFKDLSNLANIYELESIVKALSAEAEHVSQIISKGRKADGGQQTTLETLSKETDRIIAKLSKLDLDSISLIPHTSAKDVVLIPEIKKENVKDVQSRPYDYSFYELESKVSAIEKILGLDTQTFPSESQPVIPSVVRLSEKLALLSGDSEPALERRALTTSAGPNKSISQPQERTNRSDTISIGEGIDVEKLNRVYSALPLIESVAPTLPNLIDRLRTVQKLHTDGVDACQSVKELGNRLDIMTNDIQEWTEVLNDLMNKVDDAVKTSNDNLLKSKEFFKEQS